MKVPSSFFAYRASNFVLKNLSTYDVDVAAVDVAASAVAYSNAAWSSRCD